MAYNVTRHIEVYSVPVVSSSSYKVKRRILTKFGCFVYVTALGFGKAKEENT